MNTKLVAYLLLSGSILLSAMAQLFLKVAMLSVQDMHYMQLLENHSALAWLCAGLVCYGCSMLFWLFLLARWPLSLAYPMLALSYILVYIGATFWPVLNETATIERTLGVFVVVAGVILVNFKPASQKT